jgi:tetratricopeptide (TPR) repeat protein/predicted Ser/Thr protein kinase
MRAVSQRSGVTTPERFAQIRHIFEKATEMPILSRQLYIRTACQGDTALKIEVERMLEVAEHSYCLVDRTPVAIVVATSEGPARCPAQVGRYRILGVLGEGGMGVVYEAEQDHPCRRVALKLIRPGLGGPELMRRFEQESQALGRLQHSGIAQIYEAGTAESGYGPQPYLAMEFIRGESLLKYAETHRLNARQRLEIMAKVCDAVYHAHQRGIIHRDLKPANILVDEVGQPKVLDFGVARAIDSDAQTAHQTHVGQIVGTLAYMSPEQVLGNPLELDTRSDVYSLGVILFELLAGRPPYTVGVQLREAIQTIREEDPARLSLVSRAYRGDIETIVGKALEKNKTRRYISAAGMGADIQRYLRNEPIAARAPSTSYQLRMLARRHKALVAGASAVLIVLVAGATAAGWEASRAETEAATAKAVNEFLRNDLLAQASANNQARIDTKPDPDLKVRTALDRAAARLTTKFVKKPLVEASVRQTIGNTYRDLGVYPEAQVQLERSLNLRRGVLGEVHRDTLASLNDLALLYQFQGKYTQAESLYDKILSVSPRVLGEEDPDTLLAMNNLAFLYQLEGRYAQAEPLSTKTLSVRRRVLGKEQPDTLQTAQDLALLYQNEGKYAQAEPLYKEVVYARRRVLGEEHPDTLLTMNNLAFLYQAEGKYSQAEALSAKVLEVRRRVLGRDHPDTLQTMQDLAVLYQAEGEYARAEPLYEWVVAIRRRVLGEGHRDTLMTMNNLAALYQFQGRYAPAETLCTRVLAVKRRVLGEEHPDTLASAHNLATLYRAHGKYAQAEMLFARVLEAGRRKLGEEHPNVLIMTANLAILYREQGRYAQAEPLFTKVLNVERSTLGTGHPTTLRHANDLAALYLDEGKYAQTEALLREALDHYQTTMINTWGRYDCQSLLGTSLAAQRKYADAEPLLLSGYKGMVQLQATIPWERRSTLSRRGESIIQLYEHWKKPKKAAEWRKKLQCKPLSSQSVQGADSTHRSRDVTCGDAAMHS